MHVHQQALQQQEGRDTRGSSIDVSSQLNQDLGLGYCVSMSDPILLPACRQTHGCWRRHCYAASCQLLSCRLQRHTQPASHLHVCQFVGNAWQPLVQALLLQQPVLQQDHLVLIQAQHLCMCACVRVRGGRFEGKDGNAAQRKEQGRR